MGNKKKMIGVLVLVILLLSGWIIWGNSALMISKVVIQNDKIPDTFHEFRMAQISDFHNTEFGKDNEKLIFMMKECEPDVILITGDLVDSRKTDIEVSISFAKKAVSIAPTYYVTGNHEARIAECNELLEGLETAGVQVLRNERVIIERSGENIALAGVDDPSFAGADLLDDSETVTRDILSELICDENTYTVLLAHRPELFDVYVESNADLVFSGHAHGGQFRLPLIGGVVAPNQGLFPTYDSGVYTKENTDMIVSRGIGNSIIPFRINNRPEVVLVELQRGGRNK